MAGHPNLGRLHGHVGLCSHGRASLARPPHQAHPHLSQDHCHATALGPGQGERPGTGGRTAAGAPPPGGWGKHEGWGAAVQAEAKAVGSPPTSHRRAGDCLDTVLDSSNRPGSDSHVDSGDADLTAEPGRQKGAWARGVPA